MDLVNKNLQKFWIGLVVYLGVLSHQLAYSQYEVYPSGFSQVMVTNGLAYPTAMAFAPDGRIFVTEQAGNVRIIKNGALLPTSFVQVTTYSSAEAGLVGIVLDPDFAINKYVYLYYTVRDGYIRNRISRFTANGDVAVAGSEVIILELDQLNFAEQHNGGGMAFGPDNKLYVSVGDSHYSVNAQNLDTYKGKILRINSDGSIPIGNPFSTGSAQKKRIWAYGLRNPYSLYIQKATGRIFVNDVGEGGWEEINEATTAGLNFGWPNVEGTSSNPAYANPVFAYPHTDARCAITGGVLFSPETTTYPANFYGTYFYQDFCTSAINIFNPSSTPITPVPFGFSLPGQPIRLSEGIDGNLYFMSRDNGALYKIIYTTNTAPVITSQPKNTTISQGQSGRLTVSVSGAPPFTYQWQKNGVNISGATSFSYTFANAMPADSGFYRVVIKNTADSVVSDSAFVTISAPNALPIPTINLPTDHTIYRAGDVISFSGSAVDPEDGPIPEDLFVWTVEFHHNTHHHDGPPIATGKASGQYTIPNQGETASDVYYRLILTVTDSKGATGSTSVDIIPKLVSVNLKTTPSGLSLRLDGQPVSTPLSRTFVSGLLVDLSAPASQTANNAVYDFDHWLPLPVTNDLITIPDSNTTYTAVYRVRPCDVPNSLKTTAITDSSAVLSWSHSTGTDSTRYTIRWRSVDSTAWVTVDSLVAISGLGSYTLTHLTNLARYEWQIKSNCSATNSSSFTNSTLFHAATVCANQYTLKTGSWADPTVWSCNRIPVGTDAVHLKHIVTVPTNYTAYARSIVYDPAIKVLWSIGGQLRLE
ncbi:hypothetical protein GCM10028805_44900 [Spirosoma harenae]